MTAKAKKLSDHEIDLLERQVPKVAKMATRTAYARAFTVSNCVLRVDSGELVWESLDGSKTVVGKAQPRRKVNVGEVIQVRRVETEAVAGRA